jgi:hypothetical protein
VSGCDFTTLHPPPDPRCKSAVRMPSCARAAVRTSAPSVAGSADRAGLPTSNGQHINPIDLRDSSTVLGAGGRGLSQAAHGRRTVASHTLVGASDRSSKRPRSERETSLISRVRCLCESKVPKGRSHYFALPKLLSETGSINAQNLSILMRLFVLLILARQQLA